MKIELKNVKHSEFASQETNCFEATIYVDGKKAGTACNEGFGGPTLVHPRDLQVRIDAYAATLPEKATNFTVEGKQFFMKQNAETIIDDLLCRHLTARDLKRKMKNRILFVRDGVVLETKTVPPETLARALADPAPLMTKLGASRFLNLAPLDEAVDLLLAGA